MAITGIDHVAAPMERVEEMTSFYRALGFEIRTSAGGLLYEAFAGPNKINFHAPALWQRESFTLRGPTAVPGSGDFCFVWEGPAEELQAAIEAAGAPVIEGPVGRGGGRGHGTSVYVRDPDGNLLEFIRYAREA
jgi:catechol 2,3-dioxygenase-like lactoylglutathione lyase family enzyme